jgi:hypothetical protein
VTGLLAKLLSGQIRPSGMHRSAAPEPILTSPEQLSCHGLDNPDVEVVDEQDDSGSGELNVGALQRRPSTRKVALPRESTRSRRTRRWVRREVPGRRLRLKRARWTARDLRHRAVSER